MTNSDYNQALIVGRLLALEHLGNNLASVIMSDEASKNLLEASRLIRKAIKITEQEIQTETA